MPIETSLSSLRDTYSRFTDRWNQFHLEAKSGSKSPSHVFIENWTASNAATVDKNPTWLKNILIAMPATLAIAAPIVAGPVGLVITAAYAATLAPIVIASKNKEKKLDRDSDLLREIIPDMQSDYVSVIERTRSVAQELHDEHVEKGSTAEQLKTEMEELKKAFEEFFAKQFEVNIQLLKEKAPLEPHGHFDYTGANMAKTLLDDIDRLSEFPDTSISPVSLQPDLSRDPARNIEQGPEISPPSTDLGR